VIETQTRSKGRAASNSSCFNRSRGDTLHTELNTLDSIWTFDVRTGEPIRFVALGRDATSIAHNKDNEPTGVYVSNGSIEKGQLLGTKESIQNARGFFTQQHGDNGTYEFYQVRERRKGSVPAVVQQ
jgi:hypothetical protein